MRIEKISDTQVKFILTREDFRERDLNFSELTYNTDKMQGLFRDMMEKARTETGFEVDQAPLVIEAVPLSQESIMVIVSKVSGEHNENSPSPFSGLFGRFSRGESSLAEALRADAGRSAQQPSDGKRIKIPRNIAIYSFSSLDDASLAASRLSTFFKGASSLYKYSSKYYICLQLPFKTAVLKMGEIENILCEYGEKHVANTVSRGFLLEHGEKLIETNAVNKLASI